MAQVNVTFHSGIKRQLLQDVRLSGRSVGDSITEKLARTIQQQEKQTAEKVWAEIAAAARQTIEAIRLVRALETALRE